MPRFHLASESNSGKEVVIFRAIVFRAEGASIPLRLLQNVAMNGREMADVVSSQEREQVKMRLVEVTIRPSALVVDLAVGPLSGAATLTFAACFPELARILDPGSEVKFRTGHMEILLRETLGHFVSLLFQKFSETTGETCFRGL